MPEHGSLEPGQVAKRVQLGDVLNTFDAPTRDALRVWLTEAGRGYDGSAAEINRFLAALEPLETSGGDALAVLEQEDLALSGLIRDSADVFSAFTENEGQLQALVRDSARAFDAVAARDRELADTFRILPTFLTETRQTSQEVAEFATSATPLVNQLIPAARELAPVLEDVEAVAPELRRLLVGIRPLSSAARDGIPALGRLLDQTEPLLKRAKPYLGGLIPAVDYFTKYRREVAGFIGNLAATTQATLPAVGGGKSLHYLRAALPISLESLAPLPERFGTIATESVSEARHRHRPGIGLCGIRCLVV